MTFSSPLNTGSAQAPKAVQATLGIYGHLGRAMVLLMMSYWFVYDLVAPVINLDSHHYNLARLELAMRGGFFNNPFWTSIYQVCYPWSFDAVHLPFLLLGWGLALPSYLCLLGTLVIVWRLVREQHGPDLAWLSALSLLSLFMVVQQASSTKTDLAVVFLVFLWVYARNGYKADGKVHHLLLMALALAFMTGTKVFGGLFAFVLGLMTLWLLRRQFQRMLIFVTACVVSLLFWGSVETYAESQRLYGFPLGPQQLVQRGGNVDGVRGTAANFTRYSAGLLYTGPLTTDFGRRNGVALAQQAKRFLTAAGLYSAGGGAEYSDDQFEILHLAHEEYCGYGPLGALALAALVLTVFWWRPRELWWQAGVLGLCSMILICALLGYTLWNYRYLLTSMAAGGVSFVVLVWVHSPARLAPYLRASLLLILMCCAVAAPLLSLTKRPADIVASLAERRRFECVNSPLSYELLEALRREHRAVPSATAYVLVRQMSPVLMFLDEQEFPITPLPVAEFERRRALGMVQPGDLVAEDYISGVPGLVPVATVTAINPYAPLAAPLSGRVHRVAPSARK